MVKRYRWALVICLGAIIGFFLFSNRDHDQGENYPPGLERGGDFEAFQPSVAEAPQVGDDESGDDTSGDDASGEGTLVEEAQLVTGGGEVASEIEQEGLQETQGKPSSVSTEQQGRSEPFAGQADPASEREAPVGSREEIERGIEELRPIARQCYEDTLQDFPGASGRVMLRFYIEVEGHLGRVTMSEIGEETTLFENALHDCLLFHVSEVEFTLSPGAGQTPRRVEVNYPFEFATQGDGPP